MAGSGINGLRLFWLGKRPLGKISAILGTVVVAAFFFQLFRTDSPESPDLITELKEIRAAQ